eukprot:m.18518 g.18518  ORF g.18518 m.18518 type:complete len:387 (-) comp6344_c0_seq1:3105-4265(-)
MEHRKAKRSKGIRENLGDYELEIARLKLLYTSQQSKLKRLEQEAATRSRNHKQELDKLQAQLRIQRESYETLLIDLRDTSSRLQTCQINLQDKEDENVFCRKKIRELTHEKEIKVTELLAAQSSVLELQAKTQDKNQQLTRNTIEKLERLLSQNNSKHEQHVQELQEELETVKLKAAEERIRTRQDAMEQASIVIRKERENNEHALLERLNTMQKAHDLEVQGKQHEYESIIQDLKLKETAWNNEQQRQQIQATQNKYENAMHRLIQDVDEKLAGSRQAMANQFMVMLKQGVKKAVQRIHKQYIGAVQTLVQDMVDMRGEADAWEVVSKAFETHGFKVGLKRKSSNLKTPSKKEQQLIHSTKRNMELAEQSYLTPSPTPSPKTSPS